MLLQLLFGITLISVFPDSCFGMARRPHGAAGVKARAFRYGTGVGAAEGVDPDPLPSDSPILKRNPYDIMVGSRMHRQAIGSSPGVAMEGPVHARYFGSGGPSALVRDHDADEPNSAASPRFYRGAANRGGGPMAGRADSGRQFFGARSSGSDFRRGQGFARHQPIVPY